VLEKDIHKWAKMNHFFYENEATIFVKKHGACGAKQSCDKHNKMKRQKQMEKVAS